MAKWYEVPEKRDSNVVYSRIRLVRNWADYPFPGSMSEAQSAEMTKALCEKLGGIGDIDEEEYQFLYLNEVSELEKDVLQERLAINRSLAEKKSPTVLISSQDERMRIALNGDDHVRIQVLEKGLALEPCCRRADRADDYIDERISYAFDEKYGYLTAFPTNMGTGLRASVVLHLPMLSRKKNFNSLAADFGRFGTSIRGVFGEGSENYGSLYRISNQKTLGQDEDDIIELVKKAAMELDAQERRLRQEALSQKPVRRADEVYKSYGVLKYARRLTSKDAMEFLSQIMAGVTDGILETEEPCSVYALMLGIQPANLLNYAKRPLNNEEVETARADFLRDRLPKIR